MSEMRYYYLLVNVKKYTPKKAVTHILDLKKLFDIDGGAGWDSYVEMEIKDIQCEQRLRKWEFPSDKI